MLKEIIIPELYYARKLPKKILAGPFAGMKYANSHPPGGIILPKLIGTYEDELEPIWEKIKEKNYSVFINAGAAEGYYSVGFKKYLLPQIPSIAFEMQAANRRGIAKLAKLNECQVEIKGLCTKDSLKAVIQNNKAIILMDVEGAERELLDVDYIDFSMCDLVVEVHPAYDMNLEEILINRFQKTHSIEVIGKKEKKLPDIDYPEWVYEKSQFVMDEFRGPQSWLWMQADKLLKR
jgi:hypothetical protein